MKALISVSREIAAALFQAPMGLIQVPIPQQEEKPFKTVWDYLDR